MATTLEDEKWKAMSGKDQVEYNRQFIIEEHMSANEKYLKEDMWQLLSAIMNRDKFEEFWSHQSMWYLDRDATKSQIELEIICANLRPTRVKEFAAKWKERSLDLLKPI